jgi:hypothetical protein
MKKLVKKHSMKAPLDQKVSKKENFMFFHLQFLSFF